MDVPPFLMMIFVSFVGLFLFLPCFRRQVTETREKISDHRGKSKSEEVAPTASDPFITMPDHLRTNDEVVTWLTKDLPKLTAVIAKPRA